MGPIAQSVEQRTFNPWVDGSSPSGPTCDLQSIISSFDFLKFVLAINLYNAQVLKMNENNVAIIGQGYVGLPLAVAAASEGWNVIGIEKSTRILELIKKSISPIEDISNNEISKMRNNGNYQITNDESRIAEANIVIICVPTPIDEKNQPDMSFMEAAIESIEKYAKDGTLIISESTSYPGSLRSFVIPKFMNSKKNRKLYFGVAPERVNPSDKNWNLRNTPRLVSGIDENSTKRILQFYRRICDNVILVDSPEIAEIAKLLENSFRLVNVSLVNEFAEICNTMNISINKIIEAASSKPYGFMPFYPGLGIGGHCIPVDPLYFTWWANQNHLSTPLINQAIITNNKMPEYFFDLISNKYELNGKKKRIMLVGIAYKAGVSDTRNSPSLHLKSLFEKAGHTVIWHDAIIKEWENVRSASLDEVCDLVVIAVNQPGTNMNAIESKNVPVYNISNFAATIR